jgi:hypothetical protein
MTAARGRRLRMVHHNPINDPASRFSVHVLASQEDELELLDRLRPAKRKARAQVLVSTKRQVYGTKNPVPDDALLNELRSRCRKLVTTDGATGTSVELSL